MKHLFVVTLLSAFSVVGFTRQALADNWVKVVTSDYSGETYQIDLDSRQSYYLFGVRTISFRIWTYQDRYYHDAIAVCKPSYHISVSDYGWDWEPGDPSLSTNTIGGKLARAACNWY